MKQVVLLVIVIAAAVWYFDIGRKMTDASIRDSYRTQLEALNQFDAQPLCAALDEHYTANVTVRGSTAGPKTQDKTGTCADLTRTLHRLKLLSDRTGGMLEADFELEIESLQLSTDRKSATVEISTAMRLGDMTLSRSRSVDHLIRRNGRILSASSEDTLWVYRGE